MSDLSKTEIERRALAILEELADDPEAQARLLAGEDPAVVARVLRITGMAARRDAMPTELPLSAAGAPVDPPERFGAFRFVAPIGSGGMGEVWRGERDDGLFAQTVAIKLIQPHLQVRAGEAFESERRILARFEHPGIARLIDGGKTDDGRACLVMEFVDGEAFDVACAALPLAARIAVFRQVLAAVAYAHGRLVAHGDLKPSNILIDRDGRARLLDFGIARLITDEASAVLLSGAVTSSFASPARLAGEPPSIADDIFALGQLLTVVIGDARDEELAAIARKATADNATARYAGVADLLADLDRWAQRRPVSALPRTPLYVALRYVERNWKRLAAGAVLLAAVGYGAFSYQQWRYERAEADARFDDAREAARYLLYTQYDQLADHARTLKLRRQVAETAQGYLTRLAGSPQAGPAVRLDAAQGLLRLAQIQGSPQLPNVGEPEKAKPNLEAALAIARTLPGRNAAVVAAQVELELANRADMIDEDDAAALRHLDQAKAWLGKISAPDPLMLAQYQTILSTIEQWKNEPKQAAEAARAAQAILAHDDSLLALLRKSNAAELEGDGVYMSDKLASIPKYRLALRYAEQSVQRYPHSYVANRRLGITYFDVGTILTLLSDRIEGLQRLEQSAAEDRRLMAFEPDDDNLRRSLRITERARAIAVAANGRVDAGLAIMHSLVVEVKQQWDAHPGEYRRMRDYGVFEMGMGNLELQYNRTAEACGSYARAQAIFEWMGREGHLSADDRAKQLGGIVKNRQEHCGAAAASLSTVRPE